MQLRETKNEFIKGVIAGAIGSLGLYFFVEAIEFLGLIKYGQNWLAGEVVFNYRPSLFMKFIGFSMTIFFGIFWGIIISFILSKFSNDNYYILKGAVFGFTIFILNLGILDEAYKYPKDFHDNTFNILIFLIGYFIYGTITASILKKLGV